MRGMLDRDIAAIDALLSEQVDAILHAPRLRKLEGSWRGLAWLVGGLEPGGRVKIRLLTVSWAEICRDLSAPRNSTKATCSAMIYEDEFGMPGGEPFGVLLIDHEVRHRPAPGAPTDDVAAIAGAVVDRRGGVCHRGAAGFAGAARCGRVRRSGDDVGSGVAVASAAA